MSHPRALGWPINYLQGVFFDWSPLKCLSMELVLPSSFKLDPPNTECDKVYFENICWLG